MEPINSMSGGRLFDIGADQVAENAAGIFGALLTEAILFPVPHRHFTFAIPKMLRPYFRFDRNLFKDLRHLDHESLLEYLRATRGLPDGLPGLVMAIHTFGEHLDFHPHLHAMVADGLFARSGLFDVLSDVSLKPLEDLFRAWVITFLVDKGLLLPERANMLRGWAHSGLNVHRSRRVLPDEREDLERLARHIIRNPFAVEKMQVNPSGGTIVYLYRSGMNPKIRRNPSTSLGTLSLSKGFEVFTPLRLHSGHHVASASAEATADKQPQGWLARRSLGEVGYSNKMRGQHDNRAAEEAAAAGQAVQVIDVSEHQPRRIASAKRRKLINKVWEADPLLCPRCSREMKIVAIIDDRAVIERILRHLGMWQQDVRLTPTTGPPRPTVIEPWLDDPFPDYDTEPVVVYANG